MINNYTLTCSLSLQHRVLSLMHYMIINYGKLCITYYAMMIYPLYIYSMVSYASLNRIIRSTKAGNSVHCMVISPWLKGGEPPPQLIIQF